MRDDTNDEVRLELEEVLVMCSQEDPVLYELWYNEKDSDYDKLYP